MRTSLTPNINHSNDPLVVPSGPIIRVRAKRLKRDIEWASWELMEYDGPIGTKNTYGA